MVYIFNKTDYTLNFIRNLRCNNVSNVDLEYNFTIIKINNDLNKNQLLLFASGIKIFYISPKFLLFYKLIL